ncbi:MAG: hypothetical protein LBT41_05975 [Candidatus Methanoplasma sp.]|jgi:hypothetical protein|nr:hypothetical protein [Candidatus Methanoplasma sp.]
MASTTEIAAALCGELQEGGPTISDPLPAKTANGNVLYFLRFYWHPVIRPPHEMTEVSWDDPVRRRDLPPPEGRLDPMPEWQTNLGSEMRHVRRERMSVLLDRVIPAYFADAAVDGKSELLALYDGPLMPYCRAAAPDFFEWLEQDP